jgi:hypothetical protein
MWVVFVHFHKGHAGTSNNPFFFFFFYQKEEGRREGGTVLKKERRKAGRRKGGREGGKKGHSESFCQVLKVCQNSWNCTPQRMHFSICNFENE